MLSNRPNYIRFALNCYLFGIDYDGMKKNISPKPLQHLWNDDSSSDIAFLQNSYPSKEAFEQILKPAIIEEGYPVGLEHETSTQNISHIVAV